MPRVMINGVVWCKAEDEILKSAVEKYGENEWHLVASLLSGKTVKQCKTRWSTGLDPRIKKNEWSREEDEKLLYLRKLMPNRRQTIALIIGRPADQCTSRYYYLWYEAQRKAENANLAKGTRSFDSQRTDAKREIETAGRLSRNGEDNDLQMLPQACARLANIRSKKTRRFTREKRIAVIHRLKHRQHIIERIRNERNRIVNYNSESSLEEQTNSYFYDSTTRHEAPVADTFSRCLDQHLDGEHKKESEQIQRIRRCRENHNSTDSLDNVPLTKQSKVLVVPLPQYSHHKLHAFHDVQCKPGFEYTSYYHSVQRCDM